MSKKPPKKSDCNKLWMKPRRDRNIIISPEHHLIVTEGTQTEPKYFKGLKADINQKYPDRISIDIERRNTKHFDDLANGLRCVIICRV